MLVAGLRLRGAWVTRFSLVSGAVLLLGLAAVNPDAWIARHNLERFETTGKLDVAYLAGLSADALPTVLGHGLPAAQRCELGDPGVGVSGTGPWPAWNLGRARAVDALRDAPDLGPASAAQVVTCP